MKAILLVGVGVLAVAAGAMAFAALAENQLGGAAADLGARLGFRGKGGSGASQLLQLADVVAPGTSDTLKTAAITTAVGGALAGVLVYAAGRELVG